MEPHTARIALPRMPLSTVQVDGSRTTAGFDIPLLEESCGFLAECRGKNDHIMILLTLTLGRQPGTHRSIHVRERNPFGKAAPELCNAL